jgi:excinuclease ABC subunit C
MDSIQRIEEKNERIKEHLLHVPHKPGSYQMKDKNGVIIYVGKAKDLKNRVTSYFTGEKTGKTKKLVEDIDDFEYIVTSSELESFLLEINLIKKYDPKYNILLRDDKSYPYIQYKRDPYPTLKVVRYLSIKKKDSKHLFGPFVNATAARKIVALLNRLYPLKKCNGNPKDLCLYYHIHECLGYCIKKIPKEDIDKIEEEILSFLNGNDEILVNKIHEKMKQFSDNLNYEEALALKQDLDYINIILEKQKMELPDLIDRDVVNYYVENGFVSIQQFFIRHGKLIGQNNKVMTISEDISEDIESYLGQFYSNHEIPKEILVPDLIDVDILNDAINANFVYISRGPKKKLVDLAYDNAKLNLQNNFEEIKHQLSRTSGANEELESLLGMKIHRIESFDNSNLFGTYAVSGMVVFKDGMPSKNDYRKYKVSVDVNDDFHTMKEVTYRRFFRALLDKTELPDLILVDGGKSQIHAVNDTLEALHLEDRIKVCGLVKNDKHMTSDLMDGKTLEIYNIDRTSNLFHYLTRIQDEVHRFTINYHRELRSKGSISSILDNIDGIGEQRKKQLLKHFGSIKKINDASNEELLEYIPQNVIDNLKQYLKEYLEYKNGVN